MTDEEANEKLDSMSEEDIQNLERDELLEMVESLYGEQEEYEEDEPRPAPLNLTINKGETRESALAKLSMKPEYQAAATFMHIGESKFNDLDLDINAMIAELEKQTEMIRKQDLSTADAMLASQAHMLDMLFYRLVRRSDANSNSGYLDAAGTYMKLAMRAQAQCRTTWEVAAKIKNPPVIVKQQNVAHNQQVNNGQENEKAPNKLLEKTDAQQLDTRAPGEAIGPYSNVETLETVNRAKIARG